MNAKRPNSMRHLDDAIRRECGGNQAAYVRLRTLMANAVVAGMLPDGVVKGGSAIKMRYGNARTRYTTDLEDADAAFAALGLPSPGRAPLMTLEHQVAQKLHAVTGTGDRVRDLVDLQVMFSNSDIDLAATKRTCERLFAYRQRQAWPPTVEAREGWDEQYQALAEGMVVIQDVGEAIEWANTLVSRIATA